jgi:hypothetical protein
MTQSEFRAWVESIIGDMPFEEFVSAEVLEHMNRVYLASESRAYDLAREEARDAYEVTFRAMCKTMFAIGYDAGREQAQVDSLFGSVGSNKSENAKKNSDLDDSEAI